MTLLIFIAVLFVTVMVHEWGHFITAKRSGMLVEEFGFGIPPRLYAWKRGETTYSINALPFGGFVKIAGENGDEEGKDPARQFESKPWYARSLVLVAGVLCNIILAVVLFTVSFSIGTPSVSDTGTPTVVSVTTQSPVDKAGIRVGDTVSFITKNGRTLSAISTDEIKTLINTETTPVDIGIIRNGVQKTITVTPEKIQGVTMLGFAVEPITIERLSIPLALSRALEQTKNITLSIFKTVGALIASLFGGESVGGLVGPVGLAHEVRQASAIGFGYLLAFTALISINLAVLNILPFPALDGGRLVIVLAEQILRKKFSKKTIGMIHSIGFILLLLLMVVLSVKDLKNLF